MTTTEAYEQLALLVTEVDRDYEDLNGYNFRVKLLKQIGLAIQEAYANGGGSGGADELTDLSDVDTAAVTNKYALIANGTKYVGRALVIADISDFGTYLTTESNDLSSAVTWANVPDANITEGSVTQHEAALTITESQISDLDHTDSSAIHTDISAEISTLTAKGTPTTSDLLLIEDAAASNAKKKITIGDLPYAASSHTHTTADITSGTFANARISQSSVTQYEANLAIGNGNWDSSDLAVTNGGTGASNAANARTNLGLVIGTDVQAYDAELAAIAGLTSAADKLPYFTGSGTAAVTALTAAARTVLDDTTTAAMATTLGLGTGSSPHFTSVNIGHASDTTITRVSAGNLAVEGNALYRAGGTDIPVVDGGTGASDAATARTNLDAAATSHTHIASEVSRRTIRKITSTPATLVIADGGAHCDCITAGGNIIVNLPAATTAANVIYTIVKFDGGGFTVDITPNGSDNINGASATKSISTQYDAIVISSDGAQWFAQSISATP